MRLRNFIIGGLVAVGVVFGPGVFTSPASAVVTVTRVCADPLGNPRSVGVQASFTNQAPTGEGEIIDCL